MEEEIRELTADDRMSKKLCPECGVSLEKISALAHSAQHWPDFIRPDGRNDEAIRRQAMMKEFGETQKKEFDAKAEEAKKQKPEPQYGQRTTTPKPEEPKRSS